MNFEIIWTLIAIAGLALIWSIMIKLGDIGSALNKIKTQLSNMPQPSHAPGYSQAAAAPVAYRPQSSGQCRLIGVDEETAAIIMAIVTDKHPNEALRFISIKAI